MENPSHIPNPIAVARSRGAHRFEVFSPKLARRLTFHERGALDQWVLIESDPSIRTFCERPGFVLIDGRRYLADFWVKGSDREELLLLSDSVASGELKTRADLEATWFSVRCVQQAELAAARVWIDNWRRMLPCIVATRGLLPTSLLDAIERFVDRPQPLITIEREFSTGDPTLVRAAIFNLLHAGRLSASDLHTEALSLLTPFAPTDVTS